MTAYSVPPRVAHVVRGVGTELQVFLMRLPDGPPVVLDGAGALIWICTLDGAEDVASEVAHVVGEERDSIAEDVEAYLLRLVEIGWLRTSDD